MYLLLIRLAVGGGILKAIFLWLVQNVVKDLVRVKHLRVDARALLLEVFDIVYKLSIEARQSFLDGGNRPLSLAKHERAMVRWWDIDKDKVPGSRFVKLIDQAKVDVKERGVEGLKVSEPERVANVVDSNPDQEERLFRVPLELDWGLRLSKKREEKVVDLVYEREHLGLPGSDKVGVNGCSAIGQIP